MTYKDEIGACVRSALDTRLPNVEEQLRTDIAEAILAKILGDIAAPLLGEVDSMKHSLQSLQELLAKTKASLDPMLHSVIRNHVRNLIVNRLNAMLLLTLEPQEWEWDESIPDPFNKPGK